MRNLTMKQKHLIAQATHFTPALMRSLEKENDYETLYYDATRLFDDLQLNRKVSTLRHQQYDEEKFLKNWR